MICVHQFEATKWHYIAINETLWTSQVQWFCNSNGHRGCCACCHCSSMLYQLYYDKYIYIYILIQLSPGGPYAIGNNINHNVRMNKIRSASGCWHNRQVHGKSACWCCFASTWQSIHCVFTLRLPSWTWLTDWLFCFEQILLSPRHLLVWIIHWVRNYTASKASFYHPIEIFQIKLDSILQLRWWKTAWHLAVKEMSFILVQHVLPAAWCLDGQELLATHSSWDVQKGLPAKKYTSKIGTDNPISLKSLSFCWSHQSYSWQNVWLVNARNVSECICQTWWIVNGQGPYHLVQLPKKHSGDLQMINSVIVDRICMHLYISICIFMYMYIYIVYIYILRLWNYINMHFTRLHAVIWPGHLKSAQPSKISFSPKYFPPTPGWLKYLACFQGPLFSWYLSHDMGVSVFCIFNKWDFWDPQVWAMTDLQVGFSPSVDLLRCDPKGSGRWGTGGCLYGGWLLKQNPLHPHF